MRDRTPTKMIEQGDGAGAIRYAEYDETTGALIGYRYLKAADEPTDIGTELSKNTLLTDETEVNLFGNAADRTVNEALNHIGTRLYQIAERVAAITVTVKNSDGKAIPNILVNGVLDEYGNAMYTDNNGTINGYIAEGSQTLSITKYADVENYSETFDVLSGGSYTKNLVVTTRNFMKLDSSASYRFSGNVLTVDVSVGGGGGGGASGGGSKTQLHHSGGGGGGGGGFCTVRTGIVPTHNTMYSAIIGSGGVGGKAYYDQSYGEGWLAGSGTPGGSSSFMGVSAGGGSGGGWVNGGYGNGNGGNGPYDEDLSAANYYAKRGDDGNAGSNRLYTSFADSVVFGGGGGGGGLTTISSYADGKSSGAGYGGDGGNASQTISQYVAATAGQNGFGGGGGGGSSITGNEFDGANGGSGSVSFRMHLKSAA